MERNRKAGQNPPRVVAPTEEEEEEEEEIIIIIIPEYYFLQADCASCVGDTRCIRTGVLKGYGWK